MLKEIKNNPAFNKELEENDLSPQWA